jgi:transposase-like protein
MISLERKEDVRPVCPHCEAELQKVWMRELGGIFGKRYVYFCSHCRKVLGISHRKGFWMG